MRPTKSGGHLSHCALDVTGKFRAHCGEDIIRLSIFTNQYSILNTQYSMFPTINLVCTRCTDANIGALERWYNDHAQLLMKSSQLQGAELFKLERNTAGIDYFCLYHFLKIEDFTAFDQGDVMAQVRELSNAALGRGSVEIVKRTQYEGVLHRQWPKLSDEGVLTACLMRVPLTEFDTVIRWLNDVLFGWHISHDLYHAKVFSALLDDSLELFVLLAAGQELPSAWHNTRSDFAPYPEFKMLWQAHVQSQAVWLR
jgi:hypothetical protein